MLRKTFALATLATLSTAALAAQPLKLEVYNGGAQSMFQVASVLVEGKHDAVLVDAQFQRDNAQQLVEKIRASGKTLKTIYISHGDPDYYFGLDTVLAAFPKAKVVATPATVAHIKETQQAKLAYWGPILKDNAPQRLVTPEVLKGNSLTLEGRKLDVVGLDGPTPDRTFVWIPSIKAAVGGVVVFGKLHVWTADTQSPESKQNWIKTLDRIAALKPATVVPGHFQADAPLNAESVRYTRDYLTTYIAETDKAANAAALTTAMKQRYPDVGLDVALDIGSKVSKGEMKW